MDLFGNEDNPGPTEGNGGILATIRHQATAIRLIRDAWLRGKMHHGLLFWGPEGVGKMRTAQAFAQMVLCGAPQPPCGICPKCIRVSRFTHPDLLVVDASARSATDDPSHKALEAYGQDPYDCLRTPPNASIGIERIRALKAESSKARVEKGNRVAVIRDAERMTQEAAQAALKLIEEPLAGTYLVLTCRDPQSLLPTILSRCLRVRFRPLPRDYIEQVLAERTPSRATPLRLIARLSRGSLGRALAMLEEDIVGLRDWTVTFFGTGAGSAAEVAERVRSLGRSWDLEKAHAAVDLQILWLEDLLLLSQGQAEERVTHLDRIAELRGQTGGVTVGEIKRRINILEALLAAAKQNVNLGLATETALLELNSLVGERDLF